MEDEHEMTGVSVKEALRAFAEVVDEGFAEILDEVVAEHRRDVPREILLEP
jgi:hypothetical protein